MYIIIYQTMYFVKFYKHYQKISLVHYKKIVDEKSQKRVELFDKSIIPDIRMKWQDIGYFQFIFLKGQYQLLLSFD